MISQDEFEDALHQMVAIRNAIPKMRAQGWSFIQAQTVLFQGYGMDWDRAERCLLAAERIAGMKLERARVN